MQDFTKKYSLSKTLRFELKPIGKTLEHIQTKGLLAQDEERAEKYKKAKKIIDEYHKDFIEEALKGINFSKEQLASLAEAYEKAKNKEESYKKILSNRQKEMRKHIVKGFEKHEKFKTLFKKELIKQDVGKWLGFKYTGNELAEKKNILKDFNAFTTYFTGFNENRKNIYTAEEYSTAIAYRIIHDNFPKYLENSKKIEILVNDFHELDFLQVQNNLADILNGKTIKEFFALENFNVFLNQSSIENYNCVRGGKTLDDGAKIQGVNEVINLYRQEKEHLLNDAIEKETAVLESEIKKLRSCKLVELYKQILSDRDSLSFLSEKFENDKDMIDAINLFFKENIANIKKQDEKDDKNLLKEIKNLLKQLDDETIELNKIYVKNDKAITDISQFLFDDFGLIKRALFYYASNELFRPKKQEYPNNKERDGWDRWVNKTTCFSIAVIDRAVESYKNSRIEDDDEEKEKLKSFSSVKKYFLDFETQLQESKADDKQINAVNVFQAVRDGYRSVQSILNDQYDDHSKNLIADGKKVPIIKCFLDSLQNLMWFIKPLYVVIGKKDDEKGTDAFEKDGAFYTDFDFYYEKLRDVVPLYNKVRNYLTQKAYSVEKYKLNFGNPDLLGGWPVGREKACSGVIFIKDSLYFLGIMNKEYKKNFSPIKAKKGEKFYEKMMYLQAADPQKDIQNLMVIDGKTVKKNGRKDKDDGVNYLLEELKNNYLPADINDIRKKGTYSKQSENFNNSDLVKFIDYYKQRANEYFDQYRFEFRASEEYAHFGEFTDHVNSQAYQINFEKISSEYIDSLVGEGKLYLFQIYNKDFSPHSKGKPNLHTLYWKALFDEKNLADVVFKLNGEAEIFYRKASIPEHKRTIHYANQELPNKNELNNKKTSSFKYDIIKDKRFTQDKFAFHVPITINFKESGAPRFNDLVNRHLKNSPDINILSIDRGERHLAYYTLIDQKGVIKKQGSFNVISDEYNGKIFSKDYHDKLNTAEKNRDKQRKSWGSIENIKNLKEGYLSQVVHQICQMVIEHNAIVVFEDLNFGFKRGRFKVEKQIYQKLEKMLIEKLNYLVFKEKENNEPGGVLNGYQLTKPFTTFKEMGRQTGIIFYVPAYHTSKVCPATGFVNLLYPKYESIKQAQDFFKRFDSIIYNKDDDMFEFTFNYKNFADKSDGSKQNWTICTYGNRLVNYRNPEKNNQWDTKEVCLTEKMKQHCAGKFSLEFGVDLKEKILQQNDAQFFKDLIYCLKLTLQMRNSATGTGTDYLISPVKNSEGEGKFFDSRAAGKSMPENADANGAYHIGLKGLMVLDRISNWDEKSKLDLVIKNEQWYKFVQDKNYKN